jgi:hypothetical protein
MSYESSIQARPKSHEELRFSRPSDGEQVSDGNTQGRGDGHKRCQAGVRFSPLDARQVPVVDSHELRSGLERKALLPPQLTDTQAEASLLAREDGSELRSLPHLRGALPSFAGHDVRVSSWRTCDQDTCAPFRSRRGWVVPVRRTRARRNGQRHGGTMYRTAEAIVVIWLLLMALLACKQKSNTSESPSAVASAATSANPPPATAGSEPGPAAVPKKFDHYLSEAFTLGEFEYRIVDWSTAEKLGNDVVSERAGDDAVFVVVRLTEKNLGKETVTGLADNFELLDAKGRTFRPSSRGKTTLAMTEGQDVIVTELHPGVGKRTATVFEVPTEAVASGAPLVLVVQERGALSAGRGRVLLAVEAKERCMLAGDLVVGPVVKGIRHASTNDVLALVAPADRAIVNRTLIDKIAAEYSGACPLTKDDSADCGHMKMSCDDFAPEKADGVYDIRLATKKGDHEFKLRVRTANRTYSLAGLAYSRKGGAK